MDDVDIKEYSVVFYMDDAKTVLDEHRVQKGSKCKYNGPAPFKPDTLDGRYVFEGWSNEELLECVEKNVECIAKFRLEAKSNEPISTEFTEGVALEAELDATLEAGKKIQEQQRALEKDPRSVEEIVSDIKENGQTEIGEPEQDLER